MHMPPLETERLIIRPFVMDDLDGIFAILDVELAEADFGSAHAATREQRAQWLRWSTMNYEQLARLYQPPYGDRAITLRSGELIGACGYVQCLGPFERVLSPDPASRNQDCRFTTELGLFYALSPRHQRHGYATEAARAMMDYARRGLGLERIVATTTYDNAASIRVMQKLGMRVEKNPQADPPWFQVVGIFDCRG